MSMLQQKPTEPICFIVGEFPRGGKVRVRSLHTSAGSAARVADEVTTRAYYLTGEGRAPHVGELLDIELYAGGYYARRPAR